MKQRTKRIFGRLSMKTVFSGIDLLSKMYRMSPPHLHVSDPIPDEETLKKGFDGKYNIYSRFSGHPDTGELEQWFCNFEGGAQFRVYSSGMAAVTTALFAAGEMHGPIHVVAILPLYGGTYMWLRKLARSPSHHFLVTFLYANDPNLHAQLYDSIGPSTRAIIFEVAGNPTLTIPNVEEILRVAHKCKRNCITICDNTFLTGLFHPLKWGVDVVVGSGTKYIVGQSSWLMGYLGVSQNFLENCPEYWREVAEYSVELGAVLAPIEAWLTKLCVADVMDRIMLQSINALAVAQFLETHPMVERVVYPGLRSYSQHKNAMRYLETIDGKQYFGSMISFYLKNADYLHTMRFLYYLNNNTHIQHKASLGGPVDSIESPTGLSHAQYDPEHNLRCDITKNNVRLSVGRTVIPETTIAALDEALYAVNSY
ncbi:MAG: PLP-dependent transferase [Candidatus Colwellbacteria bacterium]|nr:PLP-dependent transferase [Candidatus Colwellbacteria bacterium]